MYKQFDFDTYNWIMENSGDSDLCYDVKYTDKNGEFEFVGFDDEMIYTKDNEIKPLKQFCKEIIEKHRNGMLFDFDNMLHEYYRLMNKFIPASKNPDDFVYPVFLCQSVSSPENPIINAPFYRIICIPRGK